MENIKIIMDGLDIEELCLDVTGEYTKGLPVIKRINNNIIITIERDSYIDKIYGREIEGKFYFARHEWIDKELPDIDYYEEFFNNGTEIIVGGY